MCNGRGETKLGERVAGAKVQLQKGKATSRTSTVKRNERAEQDQGPNYFWGQGSQVSSPTLSQFGTVTHELPADDPGGVVVPVRAADFAVEAELVDVDAAGVGGVGPVAIQLEAQR